MIPDLLVYMLTGVMKNERTNASTTQLYNPKTRDWAWDLVEKLGLEKEIFSSGFSEAGEILADLKKELRDELGDIKIAGVASHDTASAVVATPCKDKNPAYINSGTWSLAGLELDEPIVAAESLKENFTNEVGVNSTIRFLKNITGMWLVQESKAAWGREGKDADFKCLENEAKNCKAFKFLFNPDCSDFVAPEKMPLAIIENCKKNGFGEIKTRGEIFRAIQESIALKYAVVFETLQRLSGVKISTINIMGGASRDNMLNQFCADATGKDVVAGLVESTTMGNAIMQLKAFGDVSNLSEGREIIANSIELKHFKPDNNKVEMWKDVINTYSNKL